MQKIWYIKINGQKEGPFSIKDLQQDPRITPDTWVWKEGFAEWKTVRQVPELVEALFYEDRASRPKQIFEQPMRTQLDDELTVDMGQEPPYLFWVLTALCVITYTLYLLYDKS